MGEPSIHRPVSMVVPAGSGETVVPAVGDHVAPFLRPEEVADLQKRLRDEPALRGKLAAYIATETWFSDMGDEGVTKETVRAIAGTAVTNYEALTMAAESANGWPEGVGSADYTALALREMLEQREQE